MTKTAEPQIDLAITRDRESGHHEPTYSGVLSFMRRRYTKDLTHFDAAVWGIPFDAAVSNRPGARFGPQGVRRASAIMDLDPQYPFHIDIFEHLAVADYGDCALDYGQHATTPDQIFGEASAILDTETHLFSIGGDHFVTYPLLKAHAQKHGKLALIQFDAHQDTWNDDGGRIDHGTIITRAVREGLIDVDKTIQIGIRTHAPEDFGIEIIGGLEVEELPISTLVSRVREKVGNHPTYLTFDIDCLDPAYAPGTGTPVSGGLSSAKALAILKGLEGLNFIGGDVVEVAPAYDHADITSIAGSTVAMYYLAMLAKQKISNG